MATPKVIVLAGYGLNCEEETLLAFQKVGADGDIVHINDLIESQPSFLNKYQILAIPGGFSYGDDTGSGNAYAKKLKTNIWNQLKAFVEKDKLAIGICNGCQVLVKSGLINHAEYPEGKQTLDVTYNSSAKYQCRWVNLSIPASPSVWLKDIDSLYVPVAHGEGRFILSPEKEDYPVVAAKYCLEDGSLANGQFPHNPNGSTDDIAAITDKSGKILAIMPHPERGMFFTQRADWPLLKEQYKRNGQEIPEFSDGIKVFQNAVDYFS
ncbi:MAG: phosphoribosylformylglycinamidine synthase subunit PurQ [Alphaproteobacteria bacterium]|nr:phosphoribosylformylglycinamidine synthase subunit PurQ [Alphaproteobacteria bacterium]